MNTPRVGERREELGLTSRQRKEKEKLLHPGEETAAEGRAERGAKDGPQEAFGGDENLAIVENMIAAVIKRINALGQTKAASPVVTREDLQTFGPGYLVLVGREVFADMTGLQLGWGLSYTDLLDQITTVMPSIVDRAEQLLLDEAA